jgi:hypothetical protein
VFNLGARETNELILVLAAGKGWFMLNGLPVEVLEIGDSTSRLIQIGTGFIAGDEQAGATTAYSGFEVISLVDQEVDSAVEIEKPDGLIGATDIRVMADDFFITGTFENPVLPEGEHWSYGYIFHSSESNVFDAVFVRDDKSWRHLSRTGSVDLTSEIDTGQSGQIRTAPREKNRLTLISVAPAFVHRFTAQRNTSSVSTRNRGRSRFYAVLDKFT